MTIHLGVTPTEIAGEGTTFKKVVGTQNGKSVDFMADGAFVFIGLKPNTGFLKGSEVKLDERGFVMTDPGLQTSMPGVFSAGDVRSGATMQIASAVGEGATAALKMREFLEMQERHAVTPVAETV